jgi:hypothetical protein
MVPKWPGEERCHKVAGRQWAVAVVALPLLTKTAPNATDEGEGSPGAATQARPDLQRGIR